MKRPKASVIFILITVLIDVIGFGLIIPILPPLLEELTGEGLSKGALHGGLLIVSFGVMQFIFSPIMGALSDRFGRKPILLLSLLGLGIDYLLHAWAPTLFWLFIGRIIAGIMGASYTTATAYMADVSSEDKKSQNFGLIGAAFGLGFIIGPALGGILGDFGVRVPFYAAACLTLVNFFYGWLVLPESLPKNERRVFEWKRANPIGSVLQLRQYPALIGFVLSWTLVYVASHAVQSTWSFYTMYRFGWNEGTVGLSLAFAGLLVALVQGLLIRYTLPRFGEKKSIYIGMLLYGLGLILFAFASESWMMFAFLIPYAMGGLAGPAIQGFMSNQVSRNAQGELQGSLTALISLTGIIGPLIMNNLFYSFSGDEAILEFPGAPYLAGAVFVLLSLFGIHYSFKKLAMKSEVSQV